MSYDYEALFGIIIDAVATEGTITERINLVIDECARQHPHADWTALARIDFEGDADALGRWLKDAFSNSAGMEARSGLWFGLFNPANEHAEPTADIYVGASPEFDGNSIAWAGAIDGLESENYLNSKVLRTIYSIAYGSTSGLGNNAEYPLALAYGGIAVHSLLSENALPAALERIKGAAVGFDSGDLLFLGEFAASTFISGVRAG